LKEAQQSIFEQVSLSRFTSSNHLEQLTKNKHTKRQFNYREVHHHNAGKKAFE